MCVVCGKFHSGQCKYGITCYLYGQLGHMAKGCMNMPIQQTAAPASQTTVQMDRPMERGATDRGKMSMQAPSQGPSQFQPQGVVGRG